MLSNGPMRMLNDLTESDEFIVLMSTAIPDVHCNSRCQGTV